MSGPNIILKHGDALDLLKEESSSSVDLFIADPPYNLKKNYGASNDDLSFDDYIKFSKDWLQEARRILKPNGTIYVFMGVRFISYLFSTLEKDLGLYFNSWICWHYTQGMGKRKGFSSRHDDILMFNKSEDFTFNSDAVRIPQKFYRSINNMRGANPGDVWEFPHVHYCNKNRKPHPTQKPEALIERMILASSNEGDSILDPFAGSGTTLRVCQQLGRNCTGFELNKEYIDIINRRLAEPFNGFDSVDQRMKRVPNDLNDQALRDEYINNHEKWFLKHHEADIAEFRKEVERRYCDKKRGQPAGKKKLLSTEPQQNSQFPLFQKL